MQARHLDSPRLRHPVRPQPPVPSRLPVGRANYSRCQYPSAPRGHIVLSFRQGYLKKLCPSVTSQLKGAHPQRGVRRLEGHPEMTVALFVFGCALSGGAVRLELSNIEARPNASEKPEPCAAL